MSAYLNKIESTGWHRCSAHSKYCEVGHTFCRSDQDIDGILWVYETDDFIICIHDWYIKKELLFNAIPYHTPDIAFSSSYIKSANGECFTPYQELSANTVHIVNFKDTNFRFSLHENFPFLKVEINFKNKMIQEYLSNNIDFSQVTISDIFFDTRILVTKSLEKLANSILSCKMAPSAAEIFLEAKAMEWFSITLDTYFNKNKVKPISSTDDKLIETVANYINDHYARDIPQEFLEKIAMMSGTKLKYVFKQKYHMSITEYIQRKRMNMAETLLATSELEIRDISKAVGYSSHSRFATLFKKYKGISPNQVRKLDYHRDNNFLSCPCILD